MNRSVLLALGVFAALAGRSMGAVISIDFDVDGSGHSISAPSTFDNASPLRNTYAGVGVTFSGPSSTQGGAILNSSTFTSLARSGANFLAFSNSFVAPDFVGPETITFSTLMSDVSIYASCLSHPMSVTMQAFDAQNAAVDSTTVGLSGAGYSLLDVSSGGGIRSVTLTITGANNNAAVFDDLTATTVAVPEVGTGVVLAGNLVMVGLRRRRG